MLSDTQIREAFHFTFLERLLKLSDPSLYILKGGVNLRFFFHSPRYSEDMDIDVLGGNVTTLKKNGYKILQDAAFKRTLRVFDIEDIIVNDPEKAKQTTTTQRFRLSLITPSGQRLPTKVEFSRRALKTPGGVVTEHIDPQLARQYQKLAYRCQHYPGEVAIAQKIKALSGRQVTQARDVFDLAILFLQGYSCPKTTSNISEPGFAEAIDCLLALTWDDYKGQVVEFLDSDSHTEYGSKSAWETLQTLVLDRLGSDA